MGSRSSLLVCRRAGGSNDHGDRVLRERHYIAVGNYLWLCGDGVDHEEKSVSKPEIGNVIEPGVPADISEVSLEDACKAILDVGNIPRRLTVGPDDAKFYSSGSLADLARRFGLMLSMDVDYKFSEWSVDDLVTEHDRNTYWNPGY